jgi:hypothetical protein
MVIPRERPSKARKRLRALMRESHMFGTMDAGAVISMLLTIMALLGLGIAAVRWFKARDR